MRLSRLRKRWDQGKYFTLIKTARTASLEDFTKLSKPKLHTTYQHQKTHLKRFLSMSLLVQMSFMNPCAYAEVIIKQSDGKVTVSIDKQLVTEYLYKDFAKPIFYPLLGPNGISMTRGYPMVKGVAGEAEDHPHHKSLWFAHGNVNNVDLWAEGENFGRIVHQRILHGSDGSEVATLATENKWVDAKGETICTDTSEYWFRS